METILGETFHELQNHCLYFYVTNPCTTTLQNIPFPPTFSEPQGCGCALRCWQVAPLSLTKAFWCTSQQYFEGAVLIQQFWCGSKINKMVLSQACMPPTCMYMHTHINFFILNKIYFPMVTKQWFSLYSMTPSSLWSHNVKTNYYHSIIAALFQIILMFHIYKLITVIL